MPDFTLLGPTVLRLPFILYSSLPHEILHNWWGNSVYVDYDKGNWREGLTTYMADYWQQELRGTAANYRLNTLMNYNDFVGNNSGKNFPLRQFRGRHNSSSQAVGYGKSMMFFHMLEVRFGKDLFKKALQNFCLENQFKKVSFDEIQKSFEKITNQDLSLYFNQWLDRTGAPRLELSDVKIVSWLDNSYSTIYVLSQSQSEPYDLIVPVIWKLESAEEISQVARLTDKTQIFSLVTRSRPIKVSVDRDYHLFRHLYAEEIPATLSTILGSSKIHFFYKATSSEAETFAQVWSQAVEGTSTMHAFEQSWTAPSDGALVFIGDEDSFLTYMCAVRARSSQWAG